MSFIPDLLNEAMAAHRAGQLPRAEQLYRQILSVDPQNADALHLLGVVAYQAGQHAAAVDLIQAGIKANPNVATFHNNLGLVFRAMRNFELAKACFQRALQLQPGYAEAHVNLGSVFWAQEQTAEAAECFRQAIALKSDYAEAHNNLGNALRKLGNLPEAMASYRRALACKPDFASVYVNLGVMLWDAEQAEAAIASFRRAIALNPDYAEAHNNLGVALKLQQPHEAVACFRRALALAPNYVEAHYNLGNALQSQKRFDEAVHCYHRVLAIQPSDARSHNNLGDALRQIDQWSEALACYRRAVEIEPDFAEAHNGLGLASKELGNLDDAMASYRRALDLNPDFAEASMNLGAAMLDRGHVAEAMACFDRAVQLKPELPDTHWNRALALLLVGDFERGWREYDYRLKVDKFIARDMSRPMWDGESLTGKTILLHAEQGLGDTIQFVRYVPLVKQRGGTVILECQEALLSLVRSVPGADQFSIQGQIPPLYDVHAPLLSLPRIMHTRLESIPAQVPYLTASPALVEKWRERFDGHAGFKIGIVWQGAAGFRRDRNRSLALRSFAPVAETPGVQLISLQKGHGAEQLAEFRDRWPIVDAADDLHDFADTAAVMMNLDLVITVDTAVAHLAGALGVPTWVALPFMPDWRWLLDRDDSPWYPTMRLFRQPELNDWSTPIQNIQTALQALLATRPTTD